MALIPLDQAVASVCSFAFSKSGGDQVSIALSLAVCSWICLVHALVVRSPHSAMPVQEGKASALDQKKRRGRITVR